MLVPGCVSSIEDEIFVVVDSNLIFPSKVIAINLQP